MSQENFKKFIDNAKGEASNLANDAVASVSSTVTNAKNLMENGLNSVKEKLPFLDKKSVLSQLDFNISKNIKQADVVVQDEEKDWRLRLSLPQAFRDNAQNERDC